MIGKRTPDAVVRMGALTRKQRKKYPYHGTIEVQGLTIDIENRRGSVRRGTGPDGDWSIKMAHSYGEIRGSLGADGDPVDVYVGPNADSSLVVVVHQKAPGKSDSYDEDKCMLLFDTVKEAIDAYRKHYDRPGFYGGHTTMSIGKFKRLLTERRGKVIKGDMIGAMRRRFAGIRATAGAQKLPLTQLAPEGGGWSPLPADTTGAQEHPHMGMWWPSIGAADRAANYYESLISRSDIAINDFSKNDLECKRRSLAARKFVAKRMRDAMMEKGQMHIPTVDLIMALHGYVGTDDLGIAKGAGHKYEYKVPKPGGGFRYFYKKHGGSGIHHEDNFHEGAAFKHTDGHYHVTKKHADGTMVIRHDETGREHRVTKDMLRAKLMAEHGKELNEYVGKLKDRHADSVEGSYAKKRWAKRLRQFGHDVDKKKADPTKGKLSDKERAQIKTTIATYDKAIARLKADGETANAAKMQKRVDALNTRLRWSDGGEKKPKPEGIDSIVSGMRKRARDAKKKKPSAKPAAGKPRTLSQPVKSSNLSTVKWSESAAGSDKGTLSVEFKNGATHEYQNVTSDDYRKITGAESPGKAYNEIRKTYGPSKKTAPARGTPTATKDVKSALERTAEAMRKQKADGKKPKLPKAAPGTENKLAHRASQATPAERESAVKRMLEKKRKRDADAKAAGAKRDKATAENRKKAKSGAAKQSGAKGLDHPDRHKITGLGAAGGGSGMNPAEERHFIGLIEERGGYRANRKNLSGGPVKHLMEHGLAHVVDGKIQATAAGKEHAKGRKRKDDPEFPSGPSGPKVGSTNRPSYTPGSMDDPHAWG